LIILPGGIEGEADGDLLALVQGLAGGLLGGDDQELDLPEADLAIGIVAIEGVDLLDGLEDGLGDERGAIGPLLDLAAGHAVERLGIEPSLTELLLKELGPHHERHLRGENPACTVGVSAPDAKWHNTDLTIIGERSGDGSGGSTSGATRGMDRGRRRAGPGGS